VQVAEQPSPSTALLSSQVSVPSFFPLGHFWQTFGWAVLQEYPDSTAQEAEQPSPAVMLLSSHPSVPSFFPFPHFWQMFG